MLQQRRLAGIDLGESPAPNETTICRFRHLLERNNLGEAIFFAPSPDAAAMKPPEGLALPYCAFLRYDFSSYQRTEPL
jgi:hypothetical protein